jgi:cytochrome c-type biogenesis protein CcmE
MFKDGAEVVVEGRLDAQSVFLADNVMAKCPSKFEAKAAERASN